MSGKKKGEGRKPGWDEAVTLMRHQAGVSVDEEEDRILPRVNIDQPVRSIALQLAGVLHHCPVFRWGESRDIVTIDEEGNRELMTGTRFPSWVEQYCVTFKPRGKYDQDVSMGKDLALKIMDSDDFLRGLRRVDGVAPVRMPVRREDGRLELLEPGYDVESRILTLDLVEYRKDVSVMEAAAVLERLLGDFPWAEIETNGGFFANRSAAVMCYALLVNFCRYIWRPGDLRPLVLFVANQQGSGKSLAAQLSLAHVYGLVASADLPEGRGGTP